MTAACLFASSLLQSLREAEAGWVGEPLQVVRLIDEQLPWLERQLATYDAAELKAEGDALAEALDALQQARDGYP